MNFCTNCIHFKSEEEGDMHCLFKVSKCHRKAKLEIDIVTGYGKSIGVKNCETERGIISSILGGCGPKGKFFEQKK